MGTRGRRSVGFDDDEDGDTFVTCSSKMEPEEGDDSIISMGFQYEPRTSKRTPAHRQTSSAPRRTASSSKIERARKEASASQPRRSRSDTSGHSRRSYDSRASSHADAPSHLKKNRSMSSASSGSSSNNSNSYDKHSSSRSRNTKKPAGSRTSRNLAAVAQNGPPPNGISVSEHGSVTSYSTPASAIIPDLFTQGRNYSKAKTSRYQSNGSRTTRSEDEHPNLVETPVTWKTSFEVDAPRESTKRYAGNSQRRPQSPSNVSVMSEPTVTDPRLSEEQDAWAGIDALLETKSCDDSFCFSTTDILPSSTVKAMRRGDDVSTMFDDDASEYTEVPMILKKIEKREPVKRPVSNQEAEMPSLVEASDPDGDNDGGEGAAGGNGTLFEMFHWSEKPNIDDTKERKKKLNQTRKVQLRTNSNHDNSDTASLPSLATCREDELSVRSEISDWYSDKGSVVTEDFRAMQQERSRVRTPVQASAIPQDITTSDNTEQSIGGMSSSLGAKLVLDKQVDEYIRKLQQQLPTISEHGSPSRRGKKKMEVGFLVDIDENQSIVPESSAFDELPSMNSFSGNPSELIQDPARSKGKRDPNKSLSKKLMKSFKSMRAPKTPKPQNKGMAKGDEEKYFPDAEKQEKSKVFSANRCLLNAVGDSMDD